MIQTLFVIMWTVLVTVFWGIICIGVSFFRGSDTLIHQIVRWWAKSILFAGRIKVNVTGHSNIRPDRPYIFMSNHQSNFDIPVLLAHLNVQFRWLAKAELFKIPIFGYSMKKAGYIRIDRSNRRSAFRSLKEAAETIRSGISVLIFPEGTRSRDGHIGSFKKGGFFLALDSKVPIVPVIIHGTWSIMSKERLKIKPGNVSVEISKPIDTSKYTRKTKEDMMENVRKIISDSFEKKRGNQR